MDVSARLCPDANGTVTARLLQTARNQIALMRSDPDVVTAANLMRKGRALR